ncbi:MAG TPA: TetR/AcrR family transcriptional regulator [Fibrobacteria bacterium]|nr:TetR/AcrR family transcriptional regulator [Fibrobacteria bacterium]
MDDTREHIIQVAGRLFLQRNYDGVSIHDITQAVGMTKGALYHHFPSKEALFEEVASGLLAGYRTDFSLLPTGSLRGFYTALVANFRTREGNTTPAHPSSDLEPDINFHNLLWDAVRILPGFRATVETFHNLERAAWTEAIQAAIDRGEIRDGLDAHKLAKIFAAIPDGVGITSLLKGGPASRTAEILDLWESLYLSLLP